MGERTIDTIKQVAPAMIGSGAWIWLEEHATAIGAAVGLATIIYLGFMCLNIIVKWYKKPKK